MIVQRTLVIVCQAQVLAVKAIGVDDDDGTGLQVFDVHLEGSSVHGHKHIALIARGIDLVAAKVKLKARYTGQGTCGRPDLSRKIREGLEVCTQEGGIVGELSTGQLHTVATVAGKFDDHTVKRLEFHAQNLSTVLQITKQVSISKGRGKERRRKMTEVAIYNKHKIRQKPARLCLTCHSVPTVSPEGDSVAFLMHR